jgi:geranyl-CoA carboxylase alpha subunit
MRTLLVANRGEIAIRIMRTARQLGLRTVAVYSDADKNAEHVRAADAALRIGAAAPRSSYLDIDAVLAAARAAGADAVHPGYGFLAENARFAAACEQAGLIFVGPSADAIDAMGNKALAKQRMRAAGVPCIPGYDGDDTSTERLVQEAARIGFPLMVKAAAGGGGRGMRLVMQAGELPDALHAARSEAENAFGDGRLILERALLAPRHVEVQVMADVHGNILHLGERDCSIQRRHQKIVEESPSPAVDAGLRERMGASAVAVARQIDYRGAGTVEFLLDTDGAYYFMEMNTRLQVEHPVTEAVTGLNLVELQLRVAAGEPLPLTQADVRLDGHAIEVRLCAEAPASDFLPQTGTIARWQAASGVRTDHALRSGSVVSPWYDSMLAKIIAHGPNRTQAAHRLADALDRTVCLGLPTNRAFLAMVLRHPAFLSGDFSTGFVAQHFPDNDRRGAPVPDSLWATAAAAFATLPRSGWKTDDEFFGWSSSGVQARSVRLGLGETQRRFAVTTHDGTVSICEGGDGPATAIRWLGHAEDDLLRLEVDGLAGEALMVRGKRALALQMNGAEAIFDDLSFEPAASADGPGSSGRLRAPINGRVVKVMRQTGDTVRRGDPVIVLEAMKMEHVLAAPHDGSVAELTAKEGDQVAPGQALGRVAAQG